MQRFSTISFISALLGGLVVAGILLALDYARSPNIQEKNQISPTGMAILNNYNCPRGVTKRIILRGREDGFSLKGIENSSVHTRLHALEFYKQSAKLNRDYDEAGHDKMLIDYMNVPANISKGVFVVSLRVEGDTKNDYLRLGNFLDIDKRGLLVPKYTAQINLNAAQTPDGWQRQENTIYSAELEDIKLRKAAQSLRKISTLLEYIQLKSGGANLSSVVDIAVGDDTVVDFMGISVCEQPNTSKGVTLSEYTGFENSLDTISFLTCRIDPTQKTCNPYVGDTACGTPLPMACFRDERLPIPDEISPFPILSNNWSGGIVAYTSEVPADKFKTIREANSYCAHEFGKEWRVLSWHDSTGFTITSRTKDRKRGQRVWIDIKDQPNATCWGR